MKVNMHSARWPFWLAGFMFYCGFCMVGCAQDIDLTSDPNVQPYAGTPVSGYRLAWSDEFSGTAVDTNKWSFRTGVRLWSNQQPQNNAESNGLYYILLKKETVGTSSYTAGGIITSKLFRYGYYETRMKVPPGRGWHTSFWLMKQNLATNDTAQVELDALENDSITLTSYGINNHRWQPTPVLHFGSKTVTTPSLTAGFHVIGCEYTDTTVKYFFDGVLQQTVATTNFTPADVNIWLTSVAANLGGTTNVDDSQLPATAQYDYARFFVLGPTSSVSIVSPAGGVMLADTNQTLRMMANVSSSNTNYPPAVAWSEISGPGSVTFANATNADTTAKFSAPGGYVLQCQAVVLGNTNTATVNVSVNAPATLALREDVNGYSHSCTFIRGDSVNWNSGARDEIIVGRWNNQPLRPIFSFDLSPLGTNPVIQSVTLDLWTDTATGTGSVSNLELHPLLGTPVEGTGDGSSAANGAGTGATWVSRTGGAAASDLWTNAGGDFATNILSVVPGYDATLTGVQKTFATSPGLVALAQTAIGSGRPLNLLVLSPATEAGANNYLSRISSDDSVSVAQRPQLTLTFLGNFAPAIAVANAFVALTNTPLPLAASVSNAAVAAWSIADGAGTVTFGNAAQPATTAKFGTAGNYVLRLSASNALAQVSRDVSVTVLAAPPNVTAPQFAGGRFQFQFAGPTGLNYTVQASTNLTTWTNLLTTNLVQSPCAWADSASAAAFSKCFFRVQVGP
jgi:beta-glucanase (GH16 family)